jgi:4-diphosphocytidyl-2-C-methyl-D-erythritol kinase
MIKKKAFAKLNLVLHVSPNKSTAGQYPETFINCQINLSDEILIEQKEKDIVIICDHPDVPKNQENFIYQAAYLLKKIKGDKKLGAKIVLRKGIPIKAGFGGGSSDGAAIIRGLEELWEIKLNEKQLVNLAKKLGKDFYYSLYGGLAEVQGKGKNYKVIALSSCLPTFWLLIVIPYEEKPSTSWMYEHLNTKDIGRSLAKFDKLKKAIYQKNKKEILKNLHNDFENSVIFYYPVVRFVKSWCISCAYGRIRIISSRIFQHSKRSAKCQRKIKRQLQKNYNHKTNKLKCIHAIKPDR